MDKFVIRTTRGDTTPSTLESMESGLSSTSTSDAKLIANNRCYLKSMAETVRRLAQDFRDSRGTQPTFSYFTFIDEYMHALEQGEMLTDIRSSVPPGASHTSNDFQMSVMRTLACMVLSKVKDKYAESDSKSFCVKGRIVRDDCNCKHLSLVVCFVSRWKLEEHLVGMLHLDQSNTEYMVDRILSHLAEHNFSPQHIVSQCYDGALLISGCDGGVQAALQRKLNRYIPTIHSDHRPVPVLLVHTIQAEPSIMDFFDACELVNEICQHPDLNERHVVPLVKCLLRSRRIGYCHETSYIVANVDSICRLLSKILHDVRPRRELCLKASHLLPLMQREDFLVIGKFVRDLLKTTKPADGQCEILDARQKYLPFAAEATLPTLRSLESMHKEATYFAQCYDGMENTSSSSATVNAPLPKRQRISHSAMADSLDHALVGSSESDNDSSDSAADNNFTLLERQEFANTLSRTLDLALSEMKSRLSPENMTIIEAICALFPSSRCFLDIDVCRPLYEIAQVSKTSLATELQAAKPLLFGKIPTPGDLSEACKVVHRYAAAFPAVYELYVAALLMGIPVSDCTYSFPPTFKSHAPCEWELNLAILAHEDVIMDDLCMDDFVKEFSQNDKRLLV